MARRPVAPHGIHPLKKDQTTDQSAVVNFRSIVQSHHSLLWNVPLISVHVTSLRMQINNFTGYKIKWLNEKGICVNHLYVIVISMQSRERSIGCCGNTNRFWC